MFKIRLKIYKIKRIQKWAYQINKKRKAGKSERRNPCGVSRKKKTRDKEMKNYFVFYEKRRDQGKVSTLHRVSNLCVVLWGSSYIDVN